MVKPASEIGNSYILHDYTLIMKFDFLLERPSSPTLKIIFWVFLALTLSFSLFIFGPIMAQFPPKAGLMDIKNAWSKENIDTIISIWMADSSQDYLALMKVLNAWDFAFMAIYGVALFSWLLYTTRRFAQGSKIQRIYLNASLFLPLLAVGTDFIEGIFIAIMLNDVNNISQMSAVGASLSTFLCMIFLYSGVIMIIIGFLATARKRK
jgi:hypothetical protein